MIRSVVMSMAFRPKSKRVPGILDPARWALNLGPYIGRVLSGEKPMTEELVRKIAEIRNSGVVPAGLRRKP
jgi:hypothetical protein